MRKMLLILRNATIIIGVVCFLLSFIEPIYSEITMNHAYAGKPQKISKEEPCYFSEITSCAVAGDTLYILMDTTQELICYSLDGVYLHSFTYASYQNGRAELHRKANTLYLEDQEHNFYLFENGEFTQYLHATINAPQIEKIENEFDDRTKQAVAEDGSRFFIKKASLWRESRSGLQEILHRPVWTMLLYRKNLLLLTLACTLVCLLICTVLKKAKI